MVNGRIQNQSPNVGIQNRFPNVRVRTGGQNSPGTQGATGTPIGLLLALTREITTGSSPTFFSDMRPNVRIN